MNIVGKKDLAAMKIHALEDRGTKRDFFDVYFLAKEIILEEMLDCYEKKYHSLKDHLFNIIKSLNYFADAEPETDPRMIMSTVVTTDRGA